MQHLVKSMFSQVHEWFFYERNKISICLPQPQLIQGVQKINKLDKNLRFLKV